MFAVTGVAHSINVIDGLNGLSGFVSRLSSIGLAVVTALADDPVVSTVEAKREYGIELAAWEELPVADAMVFAVAHNELVRRPMQDFASKVAPSGCLMDVKSRLDVAAARSSGLRLWRL